MLHLGPKCLSVVTAGWNKDLQLAIECLEWSSQVDSIILLTLDFQFQKYVLLSLKSPFSPGWSLHYLPPPQNLFQFPPAWL